MFPMIERPSWVQRIRQAWEKRPIVWLSGVRRAGKTTLARMFSEAVYFNCDLPSVGRQLNDPEAFYDRLDQGAVVVFDEIHRLEDPSRLLKIAADAYPHLKLLATGSSTLSATKKFRDSLAGRKHTIYLPPVLWSECLDSFDIKELDHRFLHGGLPEPLLSETKSTSFFSEWMDSFYARDIQELFGIRNRVGFMKLLHLLLRQSGSLRDYTSLARSSDLSRHTVKAHIEAMSIAHAVFLLPPFQGGGRREITRRPKGYAFDTGFVTFVKGWDSIREDDRGLLWEHLVLDTLRSAVDDSNVFYWRDKSGREVDFVIKGSRQQADAMECKINPDRFDPSYLAVFRSLYPEGRNFVVSPNTKSAYQRRYGKLRVDFIPLKQIYELSQPQPGAPSPT
jgi:predicted AAA+ superfamily ATPase